MTPGPSTFLLCDFGSSERESDDVFLFRSLLPSSLPPKAWVFCGGVESLRGAAAATAAAATAAAAVAEEDLLETMDFFFFLLAPVLLVIRVLLTPLSSILILAPP